MPDIDDQDEKCGCGKGLQARIAKALRDNPGVIPSDLSHLVAGIRDGGEAIQHLKDLAASGGAGTAGGLGGGGPLRGDLAVSAQDAGSSPCYANSPAVAKYSADTLRLQGNNRGRLFTGGKR
jgi:hypothetical protein